MYTLGIPKRDYRRATQVLGYESAEEVVFNATLQDDGFYIFTFPEVGDEYNFRKVANKLKSEGVRVVGADAQLTEKKIMKLASLINLESLQEIDFNDPALMRARAAKDKMDQMKSNPRIGFDQVLDLRIAKRDLEKKINNKYREMQSNPDIEPEGGPVADDYGDQLNRLEARLYKINKQIASYDMSEGEDEDDEQDMADVKADIDSMMNESEDKWNAIDVSRKAEKEVDNKEWNERTAKKLDMLKKLNDAGKFKKDFDEERLQGWVDQNYSWEKLSKQFKVNEGSCGYGPDGVPGNTPGETKGMPADDRTRGMLKMLIQKEIAKYENK